MVAAVCVVAAGMGGMKAYNAENQSNTNVLLTENVEALSAGDGTVTAVVCSYVPGWTCVIGVNGNKFEIWHNYKNVW